MKIRAKARLDDNHKDIVKVFRALGCSWYSTSAIPGQLDGVVGVAGIDQRVEIKDGSKQPYQRKLTKEESNTFDEWRGRTPVVVESEEDAIILVNKLRKNA